MKKSSLSFSLVFVLPFFILYLTVTTGCHVYRFNDVSIPDSIKTVRIEFVENKARIVNPQISPRLTERLKQKFLNQTKLSQVTSDNANMDIAASITDYSFSTSGISNQQAQTNRLSINVHISVTNNLSGKTDDYDVSRSFEFAASSTLQAAEAALMDDIVRGLSDDIFNRIFSNW